MLTCENSTYNLFESVCSDHLQCSDTYCNSLNKNQFLLSRLSIYLSRFMRLDAGFIGLFLTGHPLVAVCTLRVGG